MGKLSSLEKKFGRIGQRIDGVKPKRTLKAFARQFWPVIVGLPVGALAGWYFLI